ncbi:MAG: GbsR/MarR family transcriptional regulator [Bacillota bacterium]
MTTRKKMKSTSIANDLQGLEHLVGEFMNYWGFKNIHGRIWLHLYTSTKSLDTAELMERLSVSKGLMSLAIRELLEYQVIRPAATGPHGTVYYEANPDLQAVITNVLKQREQVMLQQVQKASKNILTMSAEKLEEQGVDKNRVKSILVLTESAQAVLQGFLALEQTEDPAIFAGIVGGNDW